MKWVSKDMIKWYPELYLDPETEKKQKKIKKRMEKHKVNLRVYCIALASNEKNLLDIYCSNELLFQYYRSKEMKIIGLASSKESAIRMTADIINDVYQETGKIDVRAYFQEEE